MNQERLHRTEAEGRVEHQAAAASMSGFAHRWRTLWAALFLVLCAALLPAMRTQAATITLTGGTYRYDLAFRLLQLTNQERAKYGLSALKMDGALLEGAMLRSAETMVFFDHQRPSGESYSSIDCNADGENIAMATTNSADTLFDLWMGSPGHRANILREGFESIGIGCYQHGAFLTAAQVFSWEGARTTAGTKANARKNVSIKVDPAFVRMTFGDVGTITLTEGKVTSYQLKVYTIDEDPAETAGMSAWDRTFFWQTAMMVPLLASDFVWTSSNPSVATVNASGTVRYAGEGSATITAKLPGTSTRISVPVICKKKPPFTVTLKTKSYTYNGKARKPGVTVKVNGKTISSKYYTVKYTDNKNVGVATVTVTGKGSYKDYSGKATFEIKLKKGTLSSVKSSKKKALTVKWKKDTQAQYYQIQLSTSKNFKTGVKMIDHVTGTGKTFQNLDSKKRYYVRIRPVKQVAGKLWYGAWSSAKNAKTR